MFVPRMLAQGVGFLGLAMTDLIAVPLIFSTKLTYNTFAAQCSGLGVGFGVAGGIFTGASIGLTQFILLGYSFPVFVGTIVPTVHQEMNIPAIFAKNGNTTMIS